ncbi:MAG: hypothetical protein ACE5GB_10270 [Acidimicrobiales bacterium]
MSVDTHTTGRKLNRYKRHRLEDDVRVLIDPDLARLPVEVTLVTKGLFGRGLKVIVDGIDGAACPIEVIR